MSGRGLGDELGAGHSVGSVDVADDAAVAAWAVLVIARFGTPDLLINNAALMNHPSHEAVGRAEN